MEDELSRPALDPGTMIAERYRLSHSLGAGGSGQVHLATDERLDRKVAIKFLHQAAGENLEARFRKELAITGAINHPNVIYVSDTGRFRDLAFFVMEYIHGSETMSAAVERHTRNGAFVPLPVVRAWFTQAARALKVLHGEHKAWHRDLKPDNLLVYRSAGDPYLKILDFGLVRAPSSNQTEAGTILGTPAYMAPEWCQDDQDGAPFNGDHRADLFSLGLCLYVALTGRHPFPALLHPDPKVAYIRALKLFEVSDRTLNPFVGSGEEMHLEWKRVVSRMLEPNREKRFQTAAAIENAIAALPVSQDWREAQMRAGRAKVVISEERREKTFDSTAIVKKAGGPLQLRGEGSKPNAKTDSAKPDFEILSLDALVVPIWRRRPALEKLSAIGDVLEAYRTARTTTAVMVIVEEGCEMPNSAFRARNQQMLQANECLLTAVVTVLEGDGLNKAALRFVMNSITLGSRSAVPQHVVDSVGAGLAWIRNQGQLLRDDIASELRIKREAV